LKLTTATDVVTARDSLEWYEQKQIAVARGNAVAVRNGKTIKADILTAYMVKTKPADVKPGTQAKRPAPAGTGKPPATPAAAGTGNYRRARELPIRKSAGSTRKAMSSSPMDWTPGAAITACITPIAGSAR
jgi:hypothetical protein